MCYCLKNTYNNSGKVCQEIGFQTIIPIFILYYKNLKRVYMGWRCDNSWFSPHAEKLN